MDERLHNPYYHYHPHHPPQQPLPQHPVVPNPRGSVIVRPPEDGGWPSQEPQYHGGYGGRHASGGGGGGGVGSSYYLGKNDDRLTYSSFLGPGASHHRPEPRPLTSGHHLQPPAPASGGSTPRSDMGAVSPASLGDITYEQLEERLAQPSQMFRDFSRSLDSEAGPREPPHTHTDLNIDIDDIFAKFNYLVRGTGLQTNSGSSESNNNAKITDGGNPPPEKGESQEDHEEDADHDHDEDVKDDKRPVQPCHVCGDKAIAHLHYGGICCYSCKAFFRRAVQSGKDKMYKCKRDSDCEVSVSVRRLPRAGLGIEAA